VSLCVFRAPLPIDGFVDMLLFDIDDKLNSDGQRLLIKTGMYWANGSSYETEYVKYKN
jgi:hypothetical protein